MTIAYASVREMIRSMSNSRYLKMATPMLSGSASNPTVDDDARPRRAIPTADPTVRLIATQIPAIADPAISHFSCWRRSPDERR